MCACLEVGGTTIGLGRVAHFSLLNSLLARVGEVRGLLLARGDSTSGSKQGLVDGLYDRLRGEIRLLAGRPSTKASLRIEQPRAWSAKPRCTVSSDSDDELDHCPTGWAPCTSRGLPSARRTGGTLTRAALHRLSC